MHSQQSWNHQLRPASMSHQNSTPVQLYATCMCLPKRKGKWALPNKNLAKALDDYLAKEGCLEDPFSKQIRRNYQPCVYTPNNSWTIQRKCQSKNAVYHKSCPILYPSHILQLMRNIPWTTMTSIELRLLNTCCITQKVRCWGGNNQKDIAKEQGHGRKTYKVFSLNPFYLFGEENWNIMFKQNLRNQQPCNLLPKSPEPYQERRWQSRILHSLTLNHAFSLGHGSIKVLPTPDNMAQQGNKARNHTKSFQPCKAFDDYLAKEGCLEDPFSKQILRNYQPCVSTPNNSWTIQRTCWSKKTLSITNLAQYFYPAT